MTQGDLTVVSPTEYSLPPIEVESTVPSASALPRRAGNAAMARSLAASLGGGRPGGAGNAATARSLTESFVGGGPDQMPKSLTGPGGSSVVSTTFTGSAVTHARDGGPPGPQDRPAKREVPPTGTPTYDGAAAVSTCLPADILPADVAWDVEDKGDKWGVKVTAFTTRGAIKVNPTPNLPTTMTTPNTANPVDGGNINNTAGSKNYWKFAIEQMRGYHRPGGGRSNHWHSTAASDAHEWAHWNTDWLKNVLGGLWPRANRDIDAITIPKADAVDDVAARPLLRPKVNARIATADAKSTRDWNAVPDTPGAAGANGYQAGQQVLDGLIQSVRDYARSKKWK